jgi:hypothetical protein
MRLVSYQGELQLRRTSEPLTWHEQPPERGIGPLAKVSVKTLEKRHGAERSLG